MEKHYAAQRGLAHTLRRAPWGFKLMGRTLASKVDRIEWKQDLCTAIPVLATLFTWLRDRTWTTPKVDRWLNKVLKALELAEIACQ